MRSWIHDLKLRKNKKKSPHLGRIGRAPLFLLSAICHLQMGPAAFLFCVLSMSTFIYFNFFRLNRLRLSPETRETRRLVHGERHHGTSV